MGQYDINGLKLNIGDTLELANGTVLVVVPDDGCLCFNKCVLAPSGALVELKDGSLLRCAYFDCHTGLYEQGIHLEIK